MGQVTHDDHLCNFELVRAARAQLGGLTKRAFIPGGAMTGPGGAPPDAGGGAPPPGGMDPAATGGMDPAAMGGMDPAAGGAPPPPGGGGGGGGDDMLGQILQRLQRIEMAGAGGAGGAGGALKPKIDVNVVLTQILKILARIADQLGVQIPASEMVVNQADLMGMAGATQGGGPMPGMDPAAGAPAGGAGGIGPMQPMQPMPAAGMGGEKAGFDVRALAEVRARAAMIRQLQSAERTAA